MSQTRITATIRTKVMPCRACAKPMEVGSNTRNAPRCLKCGLTEGNASIVQMHEKSGPYYERWKMGMSAFLESLGGGGEGV